MIALIPARAGSKRIPGKNTKPLGGVPLLSWTIRAARASEVFCEVCVVSEDQTIRRIASLAGATVLGRSHVSATDTAPDIVWLRDALEAVSALQRPMAFCILRPTSPFRTADTIRRAYHQWTGESDCIDSLRAVTPVAQSPYKMWRVAPHMPMISLLDGAHPDGTPYHSSPTQTLPPVYVQTGALEMGWTRNVECLNSISGRKVSPFFCHGPEALDLNTPDDWERAERLIASGAVEPPPVSLAGLSPSAATV